MDDAANEVLLDELPTPDGALQLVAYESRGTVWVGVRPKGWRRVQGSPTQSAIGLHTGSYEHYVDATASILETWAFAVGAVAPEIARAAVRNDVGELFPARIVALPVSFHEEYRAAWGIAERCDRECTMIGYDSRGYVVEPDAVRPQEARSLAPEDRLARVREIADRALRYHATAYQRSSDPEEKQRHMNHMDMRADVLALVEEDAVDARSMMSWRSSIIARYLERATTDPWVPGVCSFCGDGPPVVWFEGPDFKTSVASPEEVSSDEAWLACSACAQLVEAEDRDGLVRRGVERLQPGTGSEASIAMIAQQFDDLFWVRRTS